MNNRSLTEAIRRNPKIGIGLGVVVLCIAAGGFYTEYSEYQSLGKAPQDLTVEQAVPSPTTISDEARWVRLPGGLKPDCNQVLEEKSSGSVTGIRVLASDAAQERWFYVRLSGPANCMTAAGPMTGILKKAVGSLPAWLKDKGITVPTSSYPLMEMSVDEGPGSIALLLWSFGAIGLLGLFTIVVFARLKPQLTVARSVPVTSPVRGR